MNIPWRFPNPFAIEILVGEEHIDGFGHVNNVFYIQWLEQCAWAHSAAVGLPLESCVSLQRGMAILRTEVDDLRPALRDDRLVVGNWVTAADWVRAERQFEIFRPADGAKLLQARIKYVCIDLKAGTPVRFPEEFVKGYVVEPQVKEALGSRAS